MANEDNKKIYVTEVLEKAARGEYGEDSEFIGKLAGVIRSITFENGYGPFICGTIGQKQANGHYEGYVICPCYGADAECSKVFMPPRLDG